MSQNHFNDVVFKNQVDSYPMILWPSLSEYVNSERSKIKEPRMVNSKPPPIGCFSQVFGYSKKYKKEYDAWRISRELYLMTKEENEALIEQLSKMLNYPYNFKEFHNGFFSLVFEYTKDAIIPVQNNKHGIAEKSFLQYLHKYFGNCIKTDLAIEVNKSLNAYTPDFIFSYDKTMLRIDVEIDEPYTLETRQPIHYYYLASTDKWRSQEFYSIDHERDFYFTNKGWFVLKFAEEQVVKEPLKCCKILADLIQVATKDGSYCNHFNKVGYPSKIKAWSISDCVELMELNSREKYLDLPKYRGDQKLSSWHLSNLKKFENYNEDEEGRSILPF